MILKVFTGKLKVLAALSSSAISVASVSASSVLSSDTRGSAVEVLTSTVDTVVNKTSELTNTYIVNPATNVGTSYKDFFTGVKDGFDLEKIKPVGEGYKTFGTTSASLVQKYAMPPSEGATDERIITRNNFETVNYYAFEYAHVVKTVLETIGPLLNGTITTIAKSGSDLGNISIQKLIAIYQSKETRELMTSALSQLQAHQPKLKQANNNDLADAMRILFSPSSENISGSLGQIKNNLDQLSGKSDSDFPDSKSLLKFIFMGDQADKKIQDAASQAKTTIEDKTTEDLVKGLLGEGSDSTFESLKNILGQISASTTAVGQDQD